MSNTHCQRVKFPASSFAYQPSPTPTTVYRVHKRQPLPNSRPSGPALQKEPASTYIQTRRQPARAAKPKSTLVAVATPGWKVDMYGLIVPDTSEDGMKPESFEHSASIYNDSWTRPLPISYRTDEGAYAPLAPDTDHDNREDDYNSDETSGFYDSSSNEVQTDPDTEFAPEYDESDWIRPLPPFPAEAAYALMCFVQRNEHMDGAFEEAVTYLEAIDCPTDLINDAFVHWLFSMMRMPHWDLIDQSKASRLCAAQLEDRIEYILETEQSKQTGHKFDIRRASIRAQKILAAYVKRLCEREKVARAARIYFLSKQKDLHWGPKNDDIPQVPGKYRHRANDHRYKEPASVSPERDMLPSIEELQPVQPTRKQPARRCRDIATNYVDLTV